MDSLFSVEQEKGSKEAAPRKIARCIGRPTPRLPVTNFLATATSFKGNLNHITALGSFTQP